MEALVSNNVATGSSAAVSATTPANAGDGNKTVSYSSPASPASPASMTSIAATSAPASPLPLLHQQQQQQQQHQQRNINRTPSPTPVSGVAHASSYPSPALLYTPLKASSATSAMYQQMLQQSVSTESSTLDNDNVLLQHIREKLRSPGNSGSNGTIDLHSMLLELGYAKPPNVIKERYLVSSHRCHMMAAAAAKTPVSYRHLIDLTSSHLRCTDIYTGKQYLCKIINEPLHKVQRAYFQLLKIDAENCQSSIYGHPLIRSSHDIVPLNQQRTYVIIAPPPPPTPTPTIDDYDVDVDVDIDVDVDEKREQQVLGNGNDNGIDYYYEDLHTYLRNKRRLCEAEARALFHQICQTVQVCHRNGVILRDLKLRRFHFIDEARTKLQYESLEGSMILDDPADDTLREKIGCPLYTAPELLCPNATYRGKPADMWSLGVLLYTMLVGQYPFYEKANYCSLITVIRHCQVQIPSMLSRSVRWLLLQLLRKNHEERITSDHILFAPWLREQRPYYMYIPANVSIPMDDDEYDVDSEDAKKNLVIDTINNENAILIEKCLNLPATEECSENESERTRTRENVAEPLDYTCATLQNGNIDNRHNQNNNNDDGRDRDNDRDHDDNDDDDDNTEASDIEMD